MKKYKIEPVAKPRMTKSDRWKQRPCVMKYWDFKDNIQKALMKVYDSGTHIIFVVPMPKSWSKKKKKSMNFMAHRQRPDIDNFLKAIFDSLFKDDSHIWEIKVTKLWGYEGEIWIKN